MKKLIISLALATLLLGLAIPQKTKAQTNVFAPIGAKWYYGVDENPMSPPPHNIGYLKIESIKDTTILGIPSKVLQKTYFSSDRDTIDRGIEIMYSDSSKVYHYLYDQFYVLYDFSLLPGDTFKIKEPYFTDTSPDTTITLVVDSNSIKIVDTFVLKVQYNHVIFGPYSGVPWFTSGEVIERIGDIFYMFPNNGLACDAANCPYLHCYSDSNIFYNKYPQMSCDTIIINFIDESSLNNNFIIYPNPVQENIYIQNNYTLKMSYEISIFNLLGEQIFFEPNVVNSTQLIELAGLKNGIYFIRIRSKEYSSIKKFIKIYLNH
ncbi:MAG: hypothetical protein A2X08_02670 [Bacteroidetes bacterium GWA2_32_17]|nr:MAG: hypothetical protein A2X08_02670 [Bacteroidetes bacterium GWA2_32_17]